eukprot:Sdes_comp20810_c0_seq1m17172
MFIFVQSTFHDSSLIDVIPFSSSQRFWGGMSSTASISSALDEFHSITISCLFFFPPSPINAGERCTLSTRCSAFRPSRSLPLSHPNICICVSIDCILAI